MSQEIPVTWSKWQINLKDACWNTGNVWIKHVSNDEKPVSSKYNNHVTIQYVDVLDIYCFGGLDQQEVQGLAAYQAELYPS